MKKYFGLLVASAVGFGVAVKEGFKSVKNKALGSFALGVGVMQTSAHAALDTAKVETAFSDGTGDIKTLAIVIIAFLAAVYVVKVLIRFIK